MQIPEMFSYVGMKDTKVSDEVLNILPKNTKWKKEFKLNTILLLKPCMIFLYIFICFFSILHLLVLLLAILKYEKYFLI